MKYLPLLALVLIACHDQPKSTEEKAPIVSESVVEEPVIERWAATDYRNENWHPEDGQYFFSEQWVWSYINENLPSDDPHANGDFSVYVDPPTGTMLLTRAESHYMDEMTEWIIIEPEGTYLSGWTEHTGEKRRSRHSMTDFDDHAFRVEGQAADFVKYFEKTDAYQRFGSTDYGWPNFNGEKYRQTFEMTEEETEVYTTALPFDVRPLYLVEQTNGDLRLPIPFHSYAYLLPADELILHEMSAFYGKKVGFEFKSSSPTTHFLDINDYESIAHEMGH